VPLLGRGRAPRSRFVPGHGEALGANWVPTAPRFMRRVLCRVPGKNHCPRSRRYGATWVRCLIAPRPLREYRMNWRVGLLRLLDGCDRDLARDRCWPCVGRLSQGFTTFYNLLDWARDALRDLAGWLFIPPVAAFGCRRGFVVGVPRVPALLKAPLSAHAVPYRITHEVPSGLRHRS
jgi:hypothetical protein